MRNKGKTEMFIKRLAEVIAKGDAMFLPNVNDPEVYLEGLKRMGVNAKAKKMDSQLVRGTSPEVMVYSEPGFLIMLDDDIGGEVAMQPKYCMGWYGIMDLEFGDGTLEKGDGIR
jgi:hypothetical protein